MSTKAIDGAVLVGVAIGGYLLYKFLQPAVNAAGNAAAAVGAGVGAAEQGIANAWVWATSGAAIQASGNVILPDGTAVPLSSVSVSFNPSANVGTFVYQGTQYVIAPNPSGGPAYDVNGNYHAVTASGFAVNQYQASSN